MTFNIEDLKNYISSELECSSGNLKRIGIHDWMLNIRSASNLRNYKIEN